MPGVSKQPGGWIEQSDLFIISSRFEGWGLVLGEAMAAGLPVISFDCEWGPAEMIEQETSGIPVPNGDVAALAETLAKKIGRGHVRTPVTNEQHVRRLRLEHKKNNKRE